MKKNWGYPYRTPKREDITPHGWQLKNDEEEWEEVGNTNHIPNWDYQQNLSMSITIEFDLKHVLEECDLTPDSEIKALVEVVSSASKVRKLLIEKSISASSDHCKLDCEISGTDLTDKFDLLTYLVAKDPAPVDDPGIGATKKASILWQDTATFSVEGSGGQFPTRFFEFPDDRKNIAWRLLVQTEDFTASASSSVLLEVNSAHPLMQKNDPNYEQTLYMMYWDVNRQLLQLALRNKDELEEQDDGSNSLSTMLLHIVKQYSGQESPNLDGLYNQMKNTPHMIEGKLQATSRKFTS
tara:strand:- start:134 stop:1021 length:888 start_codon:yes stop_codon:yes gene_type:complete